MQYYWFCCLASPDTKHMFLLGWLCCKCGFLVNFIKYTPFQESALTAYVTFLFCYIILAPTVQLIVAVNPSGLKVHFIWKLILGYTVVVYPFSKENVASKDKTTTTVYFCLDKYSVSLLDVRRHVTFVNDLNHLNGCLQQMIGTALRTLKSQS